jgi:hypothetical protein
LARKEGKIPVVVLYTKARRGGLVVVHENDLGAVAREMCVEREGSSEDRLGGGPAETGLGS